MDHQPASVKSVFDRALEIASPEGRQVYVDHACAGAPDLRQKVQALLRAYDEAGSFLEEPPVGLAATADGAVGERAGTVLGVYKLLEQIGEGGFGIVFVAEQQRPVRRRVALKVLKPGMDSRQVLARFEAERQALALMEHPHIAQIHDGGSTPSGRPYFVMELVKGVPITAYGDHHQVPVRQRLELFLHVCDAVQHAHQKGVIHRDLKPSNVLVASHDGVPVVKVIDFGVAKAIGQQLTDKTVYTQFAQLIGTPLYMSPEQAGESSLDIDTRSDIYALGVLLYDLLTGTTPFDQERFHRVGYDELRRIIREEEPPRPSTRISTLGQASTTVSANRRSDPRRLSQLFRHELDWIVMKALEKDRSRRYETAKAFAADVQRYLADEPVQACPPSPWYRFRKLAWRHRAALAATATVFVAVLVAVGGLAGSIGWALRDRGARRAGAEEKARAALEDAVHLEQEEKWPEALSTARRAREILAGIGADPILSEEVERLARDLEMVHRLEEARLRRATVGISGALTDDEGCEAAYADAFRWYGLDVDSLEPGECADAIRCRSICLQLAAGLDGWAFVRRRLRLHRWRELSAVSRAADPDRWRDRLRDALEGNDPKALQEVAGSVPPDNLPPATAVLLGSLSLGTGGAAEQAVPVLQRVQQRHPGDYWLNYVLGMVFHMRGGNHLEDAIRYYAAAVAIRPQSVLGHVNLAAALKDKGRLNEAVAEFREAIHLDKDEPNSHFGLGNALRDKGRLGEAIAEFRRAIGLRNDFPEAHTNLGNALYTNGWLDEAIAEYGAALRSKRNFPEAYLAHTGLGNALHDKGRLDGAVAEYREALRLKKDLPEAHRGLGEALRDKGRLDAAIAECREAIRLNRDYPGAHNVLGVALQDKGRHHEAIAEYREALRLQKDYPEAHTNLGNALAAMGQLEGAIAEYQQALRSEQYFPGAYTAHNGLGTALAGKGQLDAAIAEFRETIRLKKDSPAAHNNLGGALWQKGRLDEAIAEYQEALRLEPKFRDAHTNLHNAARAWALVGCGRATTHARPGEEKERGRVRRRALEWLRADLAYWGMLLDREPNKARAVVIQQMQQWLADPDFAGVRGDKALAKLPDAERAGWQKLWADVADALARAQGKKARDQESDGK
jgi:tetratricopeptide (TPR) repeat protein